MRFAVAGFVAAVLAAVELSSRLHSRFTLARWAWAWWAARLAFEALIGIISVSIIQRTAVTFGNSFVGWLAAGAAGPAVVRLRLLTLGRDEEARPVGLATVYEPIRDFIERQVDDIGADEQARWLREEIVPRLHHEGRDAAFVAVRLRTYVLGLARLTPVERLAETTSIEGILSDPGASDDEKVEILLERAVTLRAFRTISNL